MNQDTSKSSSIHKEEEVAERIPEKQPISALTVTGGFEHEINVPELPGFLPYRPTSPEFIMPLHTSLSRHEGYTRGRTMGQLRYVWDGQLDKKNTVRPFTKSYQPEREKYLAGKEERLDLREKLLVEKEEFLAAKEKCIIEKDKVLAEKYNEQDEKDKELAVKEKQLDKKEKQLHENQMQLFNVKFQETKKLAEIGREVMELEYQLKEANKDVLRLERKLFAKHIFDQYEKKLEELWNTERPDEMLSRSTSQEEKWNKFLTLDVFQVRKLLEVVKNRNLPVELIPEIARDVHAKLQTGIHNVYGPGLMKIILDPTILNQQEVDFMLCVIERTPLDVDTDVIIKTVKVKEENGYM